MSQAFKKNVTIADSNAITYPYKGTGTGTRAGIIIALMIYAALTFWATRITPDDIKICVEHTGWSDERCGYELGR